MTRAESYNTGTTEAAQETARRPWLQFISQWWLLFLHASYSLVFTLCMIYLLDGKEASVSDESKTTFGFWSDGRLTQPAVTTLVSVCLVLAKILSAAWQSLAAWRCVFILLEKHGLSLSEISCMASLHMPAWSILRTSPSASGSGKVSLRSIAVLILLLAWPCQFANPIASGALSWIPVNDYTFSSVEVPHVSLDLTPGQQWSWYIDNDAVRDQRVKRSATYAILAALAAPRTGNQSIEEATIPPAQRIVPQIGNGANQRNVFDVTVPIFEIDSFQWVSNISGLPEGIQEALYNTTSSYLTLAYDVSPLQQPIDGTAALLHDSTWALPDRTRLPSPEIFLGKVFAAIVVSVSQGYDYDCRQAESEFNPVPREIEFVNIPRTDGNSQCIAVAELQISAGVTRCHHDPAKNSTCLLSSGVINSNNNTVSPDALVMQVLRMMPEVQSLVEAMTWHDVNLQHSNLELSLRNSLTQAYQGTWSELTQFLAWSSQVEKKVSEPDPSILRARVSSRRMCIWLGINVLFVLSGILLLVVQSTCEGKTINGPVVAAVMLNSSAVIESDNTGLYNATDLDHGDVHLKLSLNLDGGTHPMLVPKTLP